MESVCVRVVRCAAQLCISASTTPSPDFREQSAGNRSEIGRNWLVRKHWLELAQLSCRVLQIYVSLIRSSNTTDRRTGAGEGQACNPLSPSEDNQFLLHVSAQPHSRILRLLHHHHRHQPILGLQARNTQDGTPL